MLIIHKITMTQIAEEGKILEKKLKSIIQQVNYSFSMHQYDLVAQTYKQIANRLMYFIKLTVFQKKSGLKILPNLLALVMKVLSAFIKSTEYQKFGHRLPLFKFVEDKFRMLIGDKVQQFDKQMLYQRLQRNQCSTYYLQWNKYQITSTQKNFLKTQNFKQLMKSLPNNQIKFQNVQCVCCSQVFIKNLPIFNGNPIFNVIINLSAQKGLDMSNLQKNLNSVCNQGGGVVLIGAKKQQNVLVASGITFNNQEEITAKLSEIQIVFEKLKPNCRTFLVQSVRVHSNYAEDLTPQQIAKQHGRVCIRIIIVPFSFSKVSYLQSHNKVKEYIYEVNRFNSTMEPMRLTSSTTEDGYESLYTYMHSKFKKQLPKEVNSHKSIYCFRPHPYQSKSYYDCSYQGEFSNINFNNMKELQKEKHAESELVVQETLKFKYQWTSLLVVNSQKNDRYVQIFVQALTQKKQLIDIVKPYNQSFKQGNGIRSVWMLSHQMPVNELRARLRSQEEKKNVKAGAVKIIPVFKNIQIDRAKLTSYNEKIAKERFFSRFKYDIPVHESFRQDESEEKVPIIQMSFSDFSQSIFAYLALEQLGCIFGYFTKEGVTYVKKTK